jgi:hypothetical protein
MPHYLGDNAPLLDYKFNLENYLYRNIIIYFVMLEILE